MQKIVKFYRLFYVCSFISLVLGLVLTLLSKNSLAELCGVIVYISFSIGAIIDSIIFFTSMKNKLA